MRRFFNNFPFVKQKDAMQCGIASLSMICQYYGRKYSTSYLSEMCHATTEGVSMSCGQTGSSCGCDGTARCNCNPPIKHQVTTMQTLVHS